MSVQRNFPILIAAGVGILGGYYAFNQPLKDYTSDMKKAEASASSVSSSSSSKESASALPPATSTAYKSGPSLSSASSPTVAGSSPSSRATGSVDKNPAFRSGEDAKEQDGTKGGGVGVKEMKERKEEGRGLPSPQGGDTKAKVTPAQKAYGEH